MCIRDSIRGEDKEIFFGEQLFFESHDNRVYASKGERNLIQDAQHVTNNAGYSGKVMYETCLLYTSRCV